MLHVEGADDVDAVGEDFQNVLVAFFPLRAGRVGVRQFVHQGDLGSATDQGFHIHFGKSRSALTDAQGRQGFDAFQKGQGVGPLVRLNIGGHHVKALPQQIVGLLKHGAGLAHARRIAQIYFERTFALARQHVRKFPHSAPGYSEFHYRGGTGAGPSLRSSCPEQISVEMPHQRPGRKGNLPGRISVYPTSRPRTRLLTVPAPAERTCSRRQSCRLDGPEPYSA